MRARLALDVSEQTCELREVALRCKPQHLLQASPKGTVPVLIVEHRTIDESLDIMRWALQRHDPEQWLIPERGTVDSMERLIAHMDTHFKQHLDRYKYPLRFVGADTMASRHEASQDLSMLENELALASYLCGERASLADMAIAPFVRQFANVDSQWFALQPWPRVQRWLERIVNSERFGRIMRPVSPWVEGTPGVSFPWASTTSASLG